MCCRRAEIATVLRCVAAISAEPGRRLPIAAELDTAAAALRLRAGIEEVFGLHANVAVHTPQRPTDPPDG